MINITQYYKTYMKICKDILIMMYAYASLKN